MTTLQGLLLAVIGGVGLAILFNLSRLVEYSLYPYAVILQVTPVVAIAPLLLIYLPQEGAVLACAWIVAFFPVLSNTTLWIIGILAGLATLFLTLGAVRYLMANGDPAEVEKAKTALRSAAIGYALAILAPVIVTVLKSLVGG